MENWRDIPGYEGRYMVSDQGRVRSLLTNRILRQALFHSGYVYVCLKDARGGQRNRTTHSLVLLAFVGPPLPKQEVRHWNGIRGDNRLSNLCYGTKVENWADRERHGNGEKGEKNPNCKLSDTEVNVIRLHFKTDGYKRGEYTRVARKYGVSSRQISNLVYGKSRLS